MSIECKAAVVWKGGLENMRVENVTVLEPQKDEVRIKIVHAGICHTDVSHVDGGPVIKQFPAILGHESAGVVESVGQGVTHISVGDHVLTVAGPQCRDCFGCLRPKASQCCLAGPPDWQATMPDGTTRFQHKNGDKVHIINHFLGISTFMQYTVCHVANVAVIDRRASLKDAVLFSCGIGTGYLAPIYRAPAVKTDCCAVFGVGIVGLSSVMSYRDMGVSVIVAIDVKPELEALAIKHGATHFVNASGMSQQQLIDKLMQLTNGGRGFDCVVEAVGSTQVFDTAFKVTSAFSGTLAVIGIPTTSGKLELEPIDLVAQKTVNGVYFGALKPIDNVPKLVSRVCEGDLNVEGLVSHSYGLHQINQAILDCRSGSVYKAIVDVWQCHEN